MITKELFVETLDKLKEQLEYDQKCGDALEIIFPDASFIRYNNDVVISQLLKVLKVSLNDDTKDSWIDYFVYELDFGTKYTKGCANYKDGSNINLSSAKKLYKFLIKEIEDGSNNNE